MEYFYSAATMGNGFGRLWHKFYDFPNFPRVTKTLTLNPKYGYPFAIMKLNKTIHNRVGLHNIGIYYWKEMVIKSNLSVDNITVSIAGSDNEIEIMVDILEELDIAGIELNFSCPNIKSYENKKIPKSRHPIYLKLNYKMDPNKFDLNNIKQIRVNSVPTWFGGMSGKGAQKYNWEFIRKNIKEGIDVAGCSVVYKDDISILTDYGCKSIGIGSTILINRKLVKSLI